MPIKVVTEIENVNIDLLKPMPNNSRRHSDEQVKKIATSIKKFGFDQPILVLKGKKWIVAGEGRYKAAKLLGLKKVPIIYTTLDELSARLRNIADNKLHDLSDFDPEALLANIQFLDEHNADLSLTAFENSEIEKLIHGADEAVAEPDAAIPDQQFSVIVDFENENDQQAFFEEMDARGLKVKLLTL